MNLKEVLSTFQVDCLIDRLHIRVCLFFSCLDTVLFGAIGHISQLSLQFLGKNKGTLFSTSDRVREDNFMIQRTGARQSTAWQQVKLQQIHQITLCFYRVADSQLSHSHLPWSLQLWYPEAEQILPVSLHTQPSLPPSWKLPTEPASVPNRQAVSQYMALHYIRLHWNSMEKHCNALFMVVTSCA